MSSWSRRRAAVAAEAAADERALEQARIAEQQKELVAKSDDEILEELGLPNPDTMVDGDDFKAFLAKTVPAHLRKRALRTLWRSNPVLACVDGLNDYDDDYLTGSFNQGPISTTYQVGKGMLAHLVEMERQKEALENPVQDVVEQELADEAAEEPLDHEDMPIATTETETETVATRIQTTETAETIEPDDEDIMMPAPRRMKFHFETDAA